jgi:hypothetical protein
MRRGAAAALARIFVIAFCAVTALYAFVASSAFAYLQFIKPRVFRWVGVFSDDHRVLAWIWLAVLALLLWPALVRRSRATVPAALLAAYSTALVVLNTVWPVLPSLHDGPRSVAAGVLSLAAVLGLALIDHVESWSYLDAQAAWHSEADHSSRDGRLLLTCLGTALLLTAGYAVLASLSLARAFEPDLAGWGLALSVATSLLDHMLIFSAVFVVLAMSARVAGGSVWKHYALLLGACSLLFGGLFARLVGDSVGLVNTSARVAAATAGLTIAAGWGGMRLRHHAARGRTLTSGVDVFFDPPAESQPGARAALAVVAVLPLAWAFSQLSARMDWDFAVLRSGVVIVWLLTFALVYRAALLRRISTAAIVVACGAPLVVHAAWRVDPAAQHTLERYVVHNASFRLSDALMREKQETSRFDRYLRANTGLTEITVNPISIDLVASLAPTAPEHRPLIFLLVVDSLRADYLSPYNTTVHFTPNIARFASENLLFPNAFTRYGGTGLSMPAIWAGSVLAHKQYVVPFDSMNALQKLLDVNGYRRMMTRSHIVEALWNRHDDDVALEQGRDEMSFDFCEAVDQMATQVEAGAARTRPVFGMTRSLNLHVAAVRNGYVPPGKSYPGFEAPYAYRVERIDGCFGDFVDRLKRAGVYDRSVVVLTADHGELIGEDGRWGHSYHLFPQVSQVPIFMHLPSRIDSSSVDTGAVTLSTDITPTLYSALGYRTSSTGTLAGHSLLEPQAQHTAERRDGSVVLSASYGAVYAVVSRNGRRLYIADAIQGRDYTFARSSLSDLTWSETAVDTGTRALAQLRIRRHIDEVARTYGLDRQF